VFVQDPGDALVPSMPERALSAVEGAAVVLPAREIGAALGLLLDVGAREEEAEAPAMPGPDADPATTEPGDRPQGQPSGLTCPDCGGAIWEREDAGVVRFRCRVGHTYSEDAMLTEQGAHVEAALWTALEVLEERAELLRKVAARQGEQRASLRRRFEASASDALERARHIRAALAATPGEADTFAVEPAHGSG
jgi:two-component system chemotaxis response regulator CheB